MARYATSKFRTAVNQLRREDLERAALKTVRRHGFPATSLRLVAKEARVPLSLLHYYFKDKDELMRCVVQRLFDGMLQNLAEIRRSERDPVRRIDRLIETYLTRTTEDWQGSLAFIEYWAECVRKGTVNRFYTQVQFRYSEPMAEALGEAGARDPKGLALALLALMTGYDTFYWSKRADPGERQRFVEFARRMVRREIGRGSKRVRLVAEGGTKRLKQTKDGRMNDALTESSTKRRDL